MEYTLTRKVSRKSPFTAEIGTPSAPVSMIRTTAVSHFQPGPGGAISTVASAATSDAA